MPERPERTGEAIPALENLVEELADVEDALDDSIVLVTSSHGSRPLSVFATLISNDGLLVSKSSQVGDDDIHVKLKTGVRLKVEVIARDDPTDLVLLRSKELNGREFVSLNTVAETKDLKHGRMLLSPNSRGPGCVSVIGSSVFGDEKAAQPPKAYVGVTWSIPRSNKPPRLDKIVPRIKVVKPDTPAAKARLRPGDQIVSAREISTDIEKATEIKSIADITKFMQPLAVGSRIVVEFKRGGSTRAAMLKLDRRPNVQIRRHAADFLVGGKSERRTGFQSFFTHDGTFQQKECGSPVFDVDCLLYTSPSPRDATLSRMPSSA